MVAHELAATSLALGTPVVIDAVNPVPEARVGWQPLTRFAPLVVLETVLPDAAEHQRRVVTRKPDLPGQVVPTWDDVMATDYIRWDERRDGARHRIDTTDIERAVDDALALIRQRQH